MIEIILEINGSLVDIYHRTWCTLNMSSIYINIWFDLVTWFHAYVI